jgi:hypothetical protein
VGRGLPGNEQRGFSSGGTCRARSARQIAALPGIGRADGYLAALKLERRRYSLVLIHTSAGLAETAPVA